MGFCFCFFVVVFLHLGVFQPNPTTATITLRLVEVHDQFTKFDLNYDNAEATKKAQENLFRTLAKSMRSLF